jgi:hypothetical protein
VSSLAQLVEDNPRYVHVHITANRQLHLKHSLLLAHKQAYVSIATSGAN